RRTARGRTVLGPLTFGPVTLGPVTLGKAAAGNTRPRAAERAGGAQARGRAVPVLCRSVRLLLGPVRFVPARFVLARLVLGLHVLGLTVLGRRVPAPQRTADGQPHEHQHRDHTEEHRFHTAPTLPVLPGAAAPRRRSWPGAPRIVRHRLRP